MRPKAGNARKPTSHDRPPVDLEANGYGYSRMRLVSQPRRRTPVQDKERRSKSRSTPQMPTSSRRASQSARYPSPNMLQLQAPGGHHSRAPRIAEAPSVEPRLVR